MGPAGPLPGTRTAITDAAATLPGTDPDRASYQIAIQAAQITLTSARNVITPTTSLAATIGHAVLAGLHPPRRPRVCARRVKSPLSRYAKHPPGKPRTCQRITKITTELCQAPTPAATPHNRSLTPAADP